LASGFTVTYAHHFLINGKRGKALYGLLYTIILATIFTALQGVEYSVSSFTISDGAFGSCFYFGTGFHGLTHVAPTNLEDLPVLLHMGLLPCTTQNSNEFTVTSDNNTVKLDRNFLE
jgi:cytochrome c oxidase subunit 3